MPRKVKIRKKRTKKKVKENKRRTVKKKKGRGTRPKRSDIKVIKIQIRGYGYYESHHEED